jgi:hypothetical protein
VGLAGASALAVWLLALSVAWDWRGENREVAEWARQMRKTAVPEEIYQQYVLNPDISTFFSVRSRRELWHTFYQVANTENPSELLDRLKEAIDVQILIRPDLSRDIRPFEEIWRTRACSSAERWYVLAAALRSLNVPARIHSGRAEIWMDGKWFPTGRT